MYNFRNKFYPCGDDVIHFLEPKLSTCIHLLQHIDISHNTYQGYSQTKIKTG